MTITPDAIARTYELIRPYVRRTPTVEISGADFGIADVPLVCKLELLQHSGSFKARGAITNLLTREIPAAGVVAASGGNHGAAVAYAARRLGRAGKDLRCRTSLRRPRSNASAATAPISWWPATHYDEALAASREWAAQSGALAIHAYEQEETLLGQGTTGLEFEQQDPGLDTLLVACGGGGLIGGIAAWYRGRVKIVAVEPEAAPTLARALDAGRPVDAPAGGIAADSLAPKRVGEMMFPFAQAFVSGVALVSDDAIQKAQQALWSVLRIVAEPGGAATFAALLSGEYRPSAGERTGVLVCGGNTAAVRF